MSDPHDFWYYTWLNCETLIPASFFSWWNKSQEKEEIHPKQFSNVHWDHPGTSVWISCTELLRSLVCVVTVLTLHLRPSERLWSTLGPGLRLRKLWKASALKLLGFSSLLCPVTCFPVLLVFNFLNSIQVLFEEEGQKLSWWSKFLTMVEDTIAHHSL